MIDVRNVSGGYANKEVLSNISFHVKEGEFFGVIGPNGSGKTTLLNSINGILPITGGEVFLDEKAVEAYTTKEFAKWVAVLPQHMAQTFRYTVKETVALGRYAHQTGLFQSFSTNDAQIVQSVMQKTGVRSYEDALLDQLSGGERQRVFLAQALAQQPKILLLDEPTNHLDLAYQKDLLDLLKQWTENKALTVLSIFHDLNLASIYCDKLLLLHHGRTFTSGEPDDVLHSDQVQKVYGTKMEKRAHPAVPKPQIMLVPEKSSRRKTAPIIDETFLQFNEQMIQLEAPYALKTMSSGGTGSGTGWHHLFVNRRISKECGYFDSKQEMREFFTTHDLASNETVAMTTTIHPEDAVYQFLSSSTCSVLIVVTAGTENVQNTVFDDDQHQFQSMTLSGNINTWVFVNGILTDTSFIQCLMTATEAKVQALHDERVVDEGSGTLATGTSTDSTLIAGTQHGSELPYANANTSLGNLVREGVYACLKQALYRGRDRQF